MFVWFGSDYALTPTLYLVRSVHIVSSMAFFELTRVIGTRLGHLIRPYWFVTVLLCRAVGR